MPVSNSRALPVCPSPSPHSFSFILQSVEYWANETDDPTLQPIFHPLHGLITLHSFPHTQLLPPTIKHSSLLGLSAGGGGSENNLGFRARRKRWGVETVHLGIDGGVGERRTEPAQEVARMVSTAPTPASTGVSEGVDRPSTTEINTPPPATSAGTTNTGTESKPKKERRARVRFGDDEILNETPQKESAVRHDHAHDHEHGDHAGHGGHGHGHEHGPTPRATVRHDRPDLYEF